jgi:hypothetical protein
MRRDPRAGHVERLVGELAADRERVGPEPVAEYDRSLFDVVEEECP